jgi:hypothetical protein
MDSSFAKVSKENGGPLEDIVQTENSSDPMNDSKWLGKIFIQKLPMEFYQMTRVLALIQPMIKKKLYQLLR